MINWRPLLRELAETPDADLNGEIVARLAALAAFVGERRVTCVVCGHVRFGRADRRYCSNACRSKAYRMRNTLKAAA